jgi:nucleoid-associated protein EbfC
MTIERNELMSRGGFGDMQQMMRQAQRMQSEIKRVQEELEDREVEASAGGGVVKAVMTCGKKLKSLQIDPAAIDPDDAEMLQDLIVAAVNEALARAEEVSQEEMAKVTGGLGGLL